MSALRDQILGANDRALEPVAVPEWGCTVWVRSLSGTERDAFEASCWTARGKQREMNLANVRAKLVTLCACDEAGGRIFEDRDLRAVGGKSARALNRVFEVAQRLNGLRDEDVEELAKNSPSGPSDDSTSS